MFKIYSPKIENGSFMCAWQDERERPYEAGMFVLSKDQDGKLNLTSKNLRSGELKNKHGSNTFDSADDFMAALSKAFGKIEEVDFHKSDEKVSDVLRTFDQPKPRMRP